jgi:hypothetical protein
MQQERKEERTLAKEMEAVRKRQRKIPKDSQKCGIYLMVNLGHHFLPSIL